jgi:hypothetical protein
VKLPPGFSVDEMPSAASAESAFGKFSLTYQQRPGELVLEEEIRVEGVTLPANEYPRVKKFFDDVRGADNQNAVLVKE